MKYSKETEEYMSVIERQMESLGVLEDADKENLKLLKIQIELYYRAVEELEEHGLTCVDQKGRMVMNPAFTVQRSAITNVIALMKELSISARQRRMLIKDDMADEHDPIDDFLADMRGDRD